MRIVGMNVLSGETRRARQNTPGEGFLEHAANQRLESGAKKTAVLWFIELWQRSSLAAAGGLMRCLHDLKQQWQNRCERVSAASGPVLCALGSGANAAEALHSRIKSYSKVTSMQLCAMCRHE
jgi:hypothetical protein